MKDFIKNILNKWTCQHEWEERYKCVWKEGGFNGSQWTQVTLICKKCGKIKQITL